MPVAGVLIVTTKEKSTQVLDQLNAIENVTTYGVHKDNNIVAVLEGVAPKDLENLTKKIQEDVPDVIGIYPTYVNYEEDN